MQGGGVYRSNSEVDRRNRVVVFVLPFRKKHLSTNCIGLRIMRKEKSGKEIVDRLRRHISSAQGELLNLEKRLDGRRYQAARDALIVMRHTIRLLSVQIYDAPPPERPLRTKRREDRLVNQA